MAHLLYDADCGFCKRTLTKYGHYLRSDVQAAPLQGFASDDPRLQQHELLESIKLVLDDGSVYSGAEAIARAKGGAALLYFVPGLRQLADFTYAWVARNRHSLPGGTASCEMPIREG